MYLQNSHTRLAIQTHRSLPDEQHKKKRKIVLVSEDLAKLKYVTTYINEYSQKNQFSFFNRLVRRFRRKKLPNDVSIFMIR